MTGLLNKKQVGMSFVLRNMLMFHYLGRGFGHRIAIYFSFLDLNVGAWGTESSCKEPQNRSGEPIPQHVQYISRSRHKTKVHVGVQTEGEHECDEKQV